MLPQKKELEEMLEWKLLTKLEKIDGLNKSIIIAGGLTNYDDLKNLKLLNLKNIEGIISGKSFYVGNIDLKTAQKMLIEDA